MTGRIRPAVASARAASVRVLSFSASSGWLLSTVTPRSLASSAVTGAKLPLAMPKGQKRPPSAEQPERGQASVSADAVEHDVHLTGGLADP